MILNHAERFLKGFTGKECKKEYTYICITESLCCTAEIIKIFLNEKTKQN